MFYFSKSKYCSFVQCPKISWLKKYKPEEFRQSEDVLTRMETGNEVGDLAMGLFGDFTEVTAYSGDRLDLSKMIADTKAEMKKGTPVICEASFEYNGLYCAVDILKKEKGGWAIYEVKSSTHQKEIYINDIAYQKYVLEKCGITLTGTYLISLNSEYVFDGNLDIHRLFHMESISPDDEKQDVAAALSRAEKLLASPEEPEIDIGDYCNTPYPCGFWPYCSKHLPNPSVFDLYRMRFSKKIDYYRQGIVCYEDLHRHKCINPKTPTGKQQLRQIQFALHDCGTYIDKERIREFLDSLSYPLYFLDFETMQTAIPRYIGTRPYAQIPFQYSLHYIDRENGSLNHKEFLAVSGTDPRRELAERLCRDIPKDACVTAYNKSFECGILRELASFFPDLSEHLLSIESNIKDLLVPFQSGWYYNRAMGGSFSIKSVLPAIFPDDPTLDYHNLEAVHHGGEAMTLFPKIQSLPPEEQAAARRNLLKYCELDTFAMVKIWEELVKVSKDA